MKKLSRWVMTMYNIDKIEEYVDVELAKLRKKGKRLNRWYATCISSLTRMIMLEEDPDTVETFKQQMIETCIDYEKQRDKVQLDLHQYVSKYTYVLITEGVFRAKDKKPIEKLADKIDNFFDYFDRKELSTYHENYMRGFLTKLEFFAKQTMEFDLWSSESSIRLFGESLVHVGKYVGKNGHCVNSDKYGRKCMAAGGMLLKAYEYWDDKAVSHYWEGAKTEFIPCEDNPRLTTWDIKFRSKDQKLTDKLLKFAHNRQWEAEPRRKSEAWNNITKLVGKGPFKYPAIDQWCD